MERLKANLGYSLAVLTIAVAVAGPLFWFGFFARAAGKTSLHVNPVFTGGEPAQTLARPGYQIVVYKPVPKQAPLSAEAPFVQVVWKPASALPPAVSEQLDLEDLGRPDCVISFQAPRDPRAKLRVNVEPLAGRVQPLHEVGRNSFSSLIARVNDTIVVRVPLR